MTLVNIVPHVIPLQKMRVLLSVNFLGGQLPFQHPVILQELMSHIQCYQLKLNAYNYVGNFTN